MLYPEIYPQGRVNVLSDKEIKAARPKDKLYRLADGSNLYLEITPAGGKLWRLRYRFNGREKMLALGKYPTVRAPAARQRAGEAIQAIHDGRDPSAERQARKERQRLGGDCSFEAVARRWLAAVESGMAMSTWAKHLRFLELDVFPLIGNLTLGDLTAPDLIRILKRIEERGALDVARRVHSLSGRIFRYGVAHGLCARDPSRDISLRDLLPPAKVKHHASVTDAQEVGALLRGIDGFSGQLVTRCALRFAALVFVRPGELRQAEWSEIDLEQGQWRIPAAKMKMDEQHLVPLSEQAISILRELHPFTGRGRYVFPSQRTWQRPMSENTVNAALRRLGYGPEEMTGHGFRSMASTLLHELGYPHPVIERQLAHAERNRVSAAYNYAEYLPERRGMMQAWADYLDGLRTSAEVVPLFKRA